MAAQIHNPPVSDLLQRDCTARPKTGRSVSTWGTVGVDHLIKADKDEKERQKKKAQLMLYTWELVEQKEKQEKEIKLKERVALQQKLIKKCEKYIEDKKTSELQKNIKKRQQEVKRRKAAVASIIKKGVTGTSSKKVAGVDCKKTLPQTTTNRTTENRKPKNFSTYKRMGDGLTTSDGEDIDTTMEDSSRNKTMAAEEDRKEKVPEHQQQQQLSAIEDPRRQSLCSKSGDLNELLLKKPENKIAKLIGLESKDHLKMDDLWNGLKSYSDKQIKPLSQHVNRLKTISMPSTKECLEEYEKPLPVDNYSGKPVLLNTVLTGKRKVKPPRDFYVVKNTRSVANDRASFGTRTIEKIRNIFNSDEIEDSSNWFTYTYKDSSSWVSSLHSTNEIAASSSNSGMIQSSTILEDIESIQFLTDDGRILSSNRNKVVDHRSPTGGYGHEGEGSHNISSAGSGARSCSRSSSNSSVWEPLSLAALGEYHGVKQRKLSGHGKFSHGSTKIWKPLS